MIGIGEKLPASSVVGVKPKFHFDEENGQSASETLTEAIHATLRYAAIVQSTAVALEAAAPALASAA